MNNFVYLIVLGAEINREDFTNFLDASSELVSDWFFSMPNSLFVVSRRTACDLYNTINTKFKDKRIFITQVGVNRQGYMPTTHWEKINNVTHA